jgi:hypothetical protein
VNHTCARQTAEGQYATQHLSCCRRAALLALAIAETHLVIGSDELLAHQVNPHLAIQVGQLYLSLFGFAGRPTYADSEYMRDLDRLHAELLGHATRQYPEEARRVTARQELALKLELFFGKHFGCCTPGAAGFEPQAPE